MTYTAIIFDFFNVIHSDPYQAWLQRHSLRDEGELAAANTATDLDELTMPDFYELAGRLSGQTADEVASEFTELSSINNAVTDVIAKLHQTYKTGLLSDSPSVFLREILDKYQLTPLFNAITISAELGYTKPDEAIFRHILRQLDVPPQQAVFIDDKQANVKAAQKIGMTGIIFENFDQLSAELEGLGISTN